VKVKTNAQPEIIAAVYETKLSLESAGVIFAEENGEGRASD